MDCATYIYTRTRAVSCSLLMDLGNGNDGCLGMALESQVYRCSLFLVVGKWWCSLLSRSSIDVNLTERSGWNGTHQELPQEPRAVVVPMSGAFLPLWKWHVERDYRPNRLVKTAAYLNMRSWNCHHVSWQEAPEGTPLTAGRGVIFKHRHTFCCQGQHFQDFQ